MAMKTKEKVEVELNDGKLVKTGPGRFEATSDDARIRSVEITGDGIKVTKIHQCVSIKMKGLGTIKADIEGKGVTFGYTPGHPFRSSVGSTGSLVEVIHDPETLKVKQINTPNSSYSAFLENKKFLKLEDEKRVGDGTHRRSFEFNLGVEKRDLIGLLGKEQMKKEYEEIIGHEPKVHFWQHLHI